MTIEKAIEILYKIINTDKRIATPGSTEALRLAILALERVQDQQKKGSS